MTEKNEKSVAVTGIATPVVGIDGINHAVRALWAYKEPAGYKDLAKGANVHPVYMSQSLSAARDAGLAESGGKRGVYKLTSDGEEYARSLSYGQESKCKQVLKQSILNNLLWTQILRFLRVSEGQARDPLALVADIEAKLGKRWSVSMRNGYANAYCSILELAELVRLEGGKMVSMLKDGEDLKQEKPQTVFLAEEEPREKQSEYSEFSIPDAFKVFVRRDKQSIEFFEKQVRDNSIFAVWLDHEKRKLEKVLVQEHETN